jgi:signal transduction histidine kinase
MDGFEVCRRLRANPALAEVPIVILTALDSHADRMSGLQAGADDFLSKPVDRDEIRARVSTILRLNRYRTLLEQRENLRKMAARLVTAQEEERRRISRELHDDLGQVLTAHMLELFNLSCDLPLSEEKLKSRLEALLADTKETLRNVRSLAQGLHPTFIDTLGLKVALETTCQEFSRRTRLPIQANIAEDIPPISELHQIVLYRLLQEALSNAATHAQASHIGVELSVEEGGICLIIEDDGKGFDPQNITSKGIGLQSMRERVALVGGKLTIRSLPGHGAHFTAVLPFDAPPASLGEDL